MKGLSWKFFAVFHQIQETKIKKIELSLDEEMSLNLEENLKYRRILKKWQAHVTVWLSLIILTWLYGIIENRFKIKSLIWENRNF